MLFEMGLGLSTQVSEGGGEERCTLSAVVDTERLTGTGQLNTILKPMACRFMKLPLGKLERGL